MIKKIIYFLYSVFQRYFPEAFAASKSGSNSANRKRKLSVKTKLLFASGAACEGAISAAGSINIIFYNQILGVPPSLCGIAFAISMIADAITDPIIGTMTDKSDSVIGRRHSFMIMSIFPMAVGIYFLYAPIEGLSQFGYFLWLVCFLLLTRFGLTLYLIPHDALGAELTDDYDERTSLFGYNAVSTMVFGALFGMVLAFVIFPTPEGMDNGFLNQSRYIVLAISAVFIVTSSVLLCTLGTLDQIPNLHSVESGKNFHFHFPTLLKGLLILGKIHFFWRIFIPDVFKKLASTPDTHEILQRNDVKEARRVVLAIKAYLKELLSLLSNKSYLAVCLWMVLMFAGLGIIGVVNPLAYMYVFELSSEDMFWASVAKLPGMVLAVPITMFFMKKLNFGKKDCMALGTVFPGALVAAPFIFAYFGFFPSNDSIYLNYAIFVPLAVGYSLFGLGYITMDSALVDIADDHELRTGYRSEGVIFSVKSFASKSTQSVGALIAGFGLEVINFPEKAVMGQLSAETENGLLILNGPLYLGFYIAAAIIIISLYSITRDSHEKTLQKLEDMRSQRQS